jgi:hypothetical protein
MKIDLQEYNGSLRTAFFLWRKGERETATDMIMKIQFPRMQAISSLAAELLASWN